MLFRPCRCAESLSVAPAVLWWDEGRVLSIWLLMFCGLYLVLYRAIVHFRTPRFLVRKADHWAVPAVEH